MLCRQNRAPSRVLYWFLTVTVQGERPGKTQPAGLVPRRVIISEVEMCTQPASSNCSQITAVVKVGSPFKLSSGDRRVYAGSVLLGVAQPVGLRQGEYLYSICITLVGKIKEVTTTVPKYAAVDIQTI